MIEVLNQTLHTCITVIGFIVIFDIVIYNNNCNNYYTTLITQFIKNLPYMEVHPLYL